MESALIISVIIKLVEPKSVGRSEEKAKRVVDLRIFDRYKEANE